MLNYHKCTDKDYDEFFPVQEEYSKLLKEIREDPDRGFLCIDWDDKIEPISITGKSSNDNF